ncbi:LuxR C-terminal-related transcriptional regulator [Arthrobacter rhombi]|uniref:LuxR C-terminal-related transcriptional regulator n=1 Tax=Arthrobacter rhombi TaxID=71253 RepID=UPI003FD29593
MIYPARRKQPHETPEFAELLKVLQSPRQGGALVIGSPGTGKTRLVRSVLAQPEIATPMMRLHCSSTLSKMPYGALSPYLSTLERTEDPVQVLREIHTLIASTETSQTPPIVVVEDAQFLDAETSFALSMLVENAAIKLIAIGAGRIEGDSTLFSLTETGLVVTIVVQPLDTEGVRALAQDLTGGELTDGTVEVIRAMSGGNPSFVTAFVRSSLDQGVLVDAAEPLAAGTETRSRWMFARMAPEPDEELIDLVREMHSYLPVGQQRALEVLALGGSQPRALLAACGGGHYRHLIEAGILVADRAGLIQIRAEIHGSVLRRITAPGRSLELHTQWNECRQTLKLPLTPIQVLWGLEASADIPDEVVLQAATQANSDLDYQLAWKICAVAGVSSSSDGGILTESWTLLGLGRYYSARATLTRLAERTEDPTVLQQALNLLAKTLLLLEASNQELDYLDEIWDRRSGEAHNRAAFALQNDQYRHTSSLLKTWRRTNNSGSGERCIQKVHSLLDGSEAASEGRVVALILLTDLYSVEGKTETALELAKQAMREVEGAVPNSNKYALHVRFRIAWSLLFAGRYTEAEEFLAKRRGTSVRRLLYEHGTLTLLEGLRQLLQGRTELAHQTFLDSISEFKLRDPLQLLSLARAMYEFSVTPVSMRLGEDRTMLDGLVGSDGQEALTQSAGGKEPTASPRFLLERAVSAGIAGSESEELISYPLIAREVLAMSVSRIEKVTRGSTAQNDMLFNLSAEMEGPRAAILTRLAAPTLVGDPIALHEHAVRAAEAGEYRVAAEALARAARIYSTQGDARACGAVLRELKELVHEHQLTPDTFVAQTLSLAELTSREEEIVELARGGHNNARIAKALTVSQRTVEGHLYRVFSKLGISERSELMELRFLAGRNPS